MTKWISFNPERKYEPKELRYIAVQLKVNIRNAEENVKVLTSCCCGSCNPSENLSIAQETLKQLKLEQTLIGRQL